MKACTTCSIFAWNAAPAKRSARSAWMWRASRANFSPTTGQRHGTPLHARVLGGAHEIAKWGSQFAPLRELASRSGRGSSAE